jgi:phosphatidyl-myo-inositol dimannoside synthase
VSLKSNPGSLNLLTVGRISRRKGQHNVINALPLILEKYPSVMYHMVGINDESLNSLIDNYNLKNHVRIYGVLTDQELTKLFQQADIFLMLSENVEGDVEGFGIAIIEANFFGIPAIGSVGCGIEQAINEGYNGRLVNSQDTEEVSNAIISILSDYKAFSLQSIEWANKHLWSKKIDDYVKILS